VTSGDPPPIMLSPALRSIGPKVLPPAQASQGVSV
jgi:hypothetical protein